MAIMPHAVHLISNAQSPLKVVPAEGPNNHRDPTQCKWLWLNCACHACILSLTRACFRSFNLVPVLLTIMLKGHWLTDGGIACSLPQQRCTEPSQGAAPEGGPQAARLWARWQRCCPGPPLFQIHQLEDVAGAAGQPQPILPSPCVTP